MFSSNLPPYKPGEALSLISDADLHRWLTLKRKALEATREQLVEAGKTHRKERVALRELEAEMARRAALKMEDRK